MTYVTDISRSISTLILSRSDVTGQDKESSSGWLSSFLPLTGLYVLPTIQVMITLLLACLPISKSLN